MFNNSTANSTFEDGIKFCLSLQVNFDITGSVYTAHIITLTVNSITAVTAVIGNFLVLFSVLKSRSLYTPSNVLVCCLALSDLMVGLVAQPCFVAHKIGELTDNLKIYCITRIVSETVGTITVGVSTFTLTAISVERYLALMLHLRYREIITCKKVLMVAISFWLILLLLAGIRFVAGKYFDAVVVMILLLALGLTFGCYHHIFKTVRRHENQIKSQTSTRNENLSVSPFKPDGSTTPSQRTMLKYKKSTIVMVHVLGVFIACYVPILIVNIAIIIRGYAKTEKIAYVYTTTLLLINSSFNPVIYCWRMSDIRRAVKSTINKIVPLYKPEETSRFSLDRSTARK